MSKNKHYAVWAGHNPGVYDSWADCLAQVKGYKGAIYKGFDTRDEALEALAHDYTAYMSKGKQRQTRPAAPQGKIDANGIAVDAACSGNPGAMEYRGVHIASGQEIFHFGPIRGTNNIGEFLAIVHALALIKKNNWNVPVVYSDSHNAILWIKGKKCKTKLTRDTKTAKAFEMIGRAEKWLADNTYDTRIVKWETRQWGEIPADFGRK